MNRRLASSTRTAPTTALDAEPTDLSAGGDIEQAEAEAIRRELLNHETAVKSIGSLQGVFAFLIFLGVVGRILALSQTMVTPLARNLAILNVVINLCLGVLCVAICIGLHRLQTWARWTSIVLISLNLFFLALAMIAILLSGAVPVAAIVLLASAIPGYMLYLLVSHKATRIFTPEYRAIVAQTPHIKYRTSLVLKILLGLLVALMTLAIMAALFGGSR